MAIVKKKANRPTKNRKYQVLVRMEKLEPLHIAGENEKWQLFFTFTTVENDMAVPPKIQHRAAT